MKTFLYIIIFLFALPFCGKSQLNDVISLRKKTHVIKTYFAGDHISFVAKNGAFRDAQITAIKKDTVYLQEFLVQRIPTTYGGYILDTAGSFRYAYDYRDIHSFGKSHKGFDLAGSGAALFGGGAVLTVASLVVLAADKAKFSPVLLGAGVGGVVLGYFLSKAASKPMIIGKKNYNIVYTNLQK